MPGNLAAECPEYQAWNLRARKSRILDNFCLVFRIITLILGTAIFTTAFLNFPGISEFATYLTWLESGAGILLGLQILILCIVQLSCVGSKSGYGNYELYYWTNIGDMFTMLISICVTIQIGVNHQIRPYSVSLFAMYLISFLLSAINLAFDVAQVKLARTYAHT